MKLIILSQTRCLQQSSTYLSFIQRISRPHDHSIQLFVNVQSKEQTKQSITSSDNCTFISTKLLSLSESRNLLIDYVASRTDVSASALCAFVDDDIVLPDFNFSLSFFKSFIDLPYPVLFVGELRTPSTRLSRHIPFVIHPFSLGLSHINYILGTTILLGSQIYNILVVLMFLWVLVHFTVVVRKLSS